MAEPKLFSSPLSLAPIWLFLPIVGAIVAASLEPIPPYDYWWPIVAGRMTAALGEIPSTNAFLYTMPADAEFVNQPWLGQLILYHVHEAAGPGGNVLLRNILLGVAWLVVMFTMLKRTNEPRVAGALGLVAVMATMPVVSVRTRMFALLPFCMLVLWLNLAAQDEDEGLKLPHPRLFGGLLLATVFWANTHGSFALAPVLVGIVATGVCGERLLNRTLEAKVLGRWAIAVIGITVATFLNPQGPAIYAYVAKLAVTSNVASTVSEWAPPSISEPIGVFYLGLLVAYLTILIYRRAQMQIWEALLLLGTTYLASSAVRNLFWWSVVAAIVVAPHALAVFESKLSESETSTNQGKVNAGILTALIIAVLVIQPFALLEPIGSAFTEGHSRRGSGRAILSYENALDSVEALRDGGAKRVFHDQAVGGLVEFYLANPTGQVAFVDQRMELIPEPIWDEYFALSDGAKGWEKEMDRREVDGLVLSIESQPKLIQEAIKSPRWRLVELDEAHVAFLKR